MYHHIKRHKTNGGGKRLHYYLKGDQGASYPRPTTLGARFGLVGPRRGWGELGRKREGKGRSEQ